MGLKKLAVAIPLLMGCSTAIAGTYVMGGLTPTGQKAFPNINNDGIELTTDFNSQGKDVLYVNMDSENLDIDAINNALESGALVVADATVMNDLARSSAKLSKIFGVGIESQLTVIYATDKGRQYIVAKPNMAVSGNYAVKYDYPELTDVNQETSEYSEVIVEDGGEAVPLDDEGYIKYVKGENSDATIESVNAELLLDAIEHSNTMDNRLLDVALAGGARPYLPEFSYDITLRSPYNKCTLKPSWDSNEWNFNFCDDTKGMTAEINYNVSLIRSIRAPKEKEAGYTKNAKYARISVSDTGGEGGGVHLRDEIRREHVWFQSWQNNTSRLGPYAKDYTLSVKHVGGVKPLISKRSPKNENREYNKEERRGFEVGVNLSAKANVDEKGPSGGIEAGVSISQSHIRVLRWNTKEYSILDKTSLSDFEVAFTRGDICQDTLRGYCSWTTPIWDQSWVMDKNKFNPISHASHTPNADVIYEVPASENGSTTFRLGTSFKVSAAYSRVMYLGWFLGKQVEGQAFKTFSLGSNITVDWNHVLFEPEAHVRLRSMKENNACLDVEGGAPAVTPAPGTRVIKYSCHKGYNQKWGLDGLERYKSRVGKNRCLAVDSENNLRIQECNDNLAQKWYWEGDRLYSRLKSPTNERMTVNGDNYHMRVVPESQDSTSIWRNELTTLFDKNDNNN